MVNDEILGAYLDGELDAEARAGVERAAAENAGVALRLKQLQQADAVLREAMAAPGGVAPDRDISHWILGGADATRRDWRRMARFAAPLAAACLVGVLFGRFVTPAGAPGAGLASLRVDAALAQALDGTPSGETASVLGGEAQMALSFRTDVGVWCRQFRLTSTHGASDALACRDDGAWRVRAQATILEPVEGQYRIAGADDGEAIDLVIERLGGVTVLDEAEEADAITRGWR